MTTLMVVNVGDLVLDAYDVMGLTAIACLDANRQCISCIDEDAYDRIRELDVWAHVQATRIKKGTGAVAPPSVLAAKEVPIYDDEVQVLVDVPVAIPPVKLMNLKGHISELQYDLVNNRDFADEDMKAYEELPGYPNYGALVIDKSGIEGCEGQGVFWTGKQPLTKGQNVCWMWGKFVTIGSEEYEAGDKAGRLVRCQGYCDEDDIPLFFVASVGSVASYINLPPVGVAPNCQLLEDYREALGPFAFPVRALTTIEPGSITFT